MNEYSPRNSPVQRERLTFDELFDVLSNSSRRRILTALVDADPRAEPEFGIAEFARDDRRDDDLARLHHTHLPKLDDAGVIEWNRHSQTIERGPRFDDIAPLVELLLDRQEELPANWP